MATKCDESTAKYAAKTLQIISEEPDYEITNIMVQMLYGNSSALSTSLRGGEHGHIGLIMNPTLYATLSNTPYVLPPDPGIIPVIPTNTTAA